jgi:Tol biopolymer transport system component
MDTEPSLNADGTLIAFVSDRPGGSGGRDVYLFDRRADRLLPLPGLNSPAHEQSPALSPDGRFLAFVSERLAGAGERDVYLYDRQSQKLLATPGLNSKQEDFDPCVVVVAAPP